MISSIQLRNERAEYYTFREKVNNLAQELLTSYTSFLNTYNMLNDAYQIDEEAGDRGIIKNSYQALKDNYDLLVGTTIPAINNKIDNLSHQIRQVEIKEEEERKIEESSTSSNNVY